MLLEQINNYEIFRPKCDYSKKILHGIATFDVGISPVFPYLNAELGGWDYDRNNQVLMLKLSDAKGFTLQQHEIAIKGARDIEEDHVLLERIKGQINQVFERREEITPRYTGQAGLKVMNILRLLPMTNCKSCGTPPAWPTPRACGKERATSRTARPCGKKSTGKSGKSCKHTSRVSAGKLWMRINEKGSPDANICSDNSPGRLLLDSGLDPDGQQPGHRCPPGGTSGNCP